MTSFWQRFFTIIDFPFKLIAVGLIQLYRYTLSSIAGRTCRHLPTCSEYTRDAIWRFGFWPGGWMGLSRIMRCGPGGTHGYDPVPKELPKGAKWYLPWRYGFWRKIPNPESKQCCDHESSKLDQ